MSDQELSTVTVARRWFTTGRAETRAIAWLIVLAVVVALVVFLSHQFSREAGRVASIWPLNALLLAIILRWPAASPVRVLIVGAMVNVIVDMAMGDTAFNAILLSLANALEILVCIRVLRRPGVRFDISRPADLVRFILVGGVAGPAASAVIAAITLSNTVPFQETLGVWFAADALGMLIFAPALLSIGRSGSSQAFERQSPVEWAIGTAILAATLLIVFGQKSYPLLFLVPPALVLATFRGGVTATAASLILTALVAIVFSVAGYGPTRLIPGSETERVLILQFFLAVMTLTSLPVAAALAEGSRANASLRAAREEAEHARVAALASEARYRVLADYSTDIVVRFGRGGIISYASPACRMLGIEPEQAVGRSTGDFMAPDDRALSMKRIEDLLDDTDPDPSLRREFRVVRGDGSAIWLEGSPSVVRNAAGVPVEIVSTYRDVTARRQLEDDLRTARAEAEEARIAAQASETHYRTLADYSTDIVVRLGRDGIISYVSPACSMLGISPEQAVGRSTIDFAIPEDRAFAAMTVADLFSGAEPDRSIRREFRVPRADGSLMWLEGNPNIIRNAKGDPVEVVSTYRDVTARRQLEDELRLANQAAQEATEAAHASEIRFRAMAEISRDMIARMDLNGTIRFVSPSCESVMGYSQQAMVGTTTLSHTHPEDTESVQAYFSSLIAEGPDAPPRPYTFRAIRGDGRIIWLEGIPRILFDDTGRPKEIQDSARDVTARKELEQALAEARAAADVAAAAKADFLANMSHELRTPLNSIIGFTQLLANSDALAPAERRHVDLVSMSSRGLLTIVNDILDFSSLEAGSIRLEDRAFSVAEAVRHSIDSLLIQADSKNLQLDMCTEGALEPLLIGDEARLQQILLNLIGNAIKFTASGGVNVSIVAGHMAEGRQQIRIAVRDTGIGIPIDRRERLFERFSQVESSINRRFGGSGLGLAITRSLVDLMKGRIGFDSEEGQGTTFWVELDLGVGTAPGVLTHRKSDPSAKSAATRAMRILVVDDVDLNRELAAAFLAGSMHDVDLARDGLEAIALARSRNYDIVLMDVQMPGMDGLEAARAIRALPACQDLPIIAMTAQALPDQIAACRDAGMNDYLPKPISADGLLTMIAKWAFDADRVALKQPDVSDVVAGLRKRFVERSRTDLQRMIELLATQTGAESEELFVLVHRFAGTAGTFGYKEAGEAALFLDQEIANGRVPNPGAFAPLLSAVERVVQAA